VTGRASVPVGSFATARPLPYDASMDRLSNIESDVKLLKWIGGFNVALSMAILALLLRLVAS